MIKDFNRPRRFKPGWHLLQGMLLALAVPAFVVTLMGAKQNSGYCGGGSVPYYCEGVTLEGEGALWNSPLTSSRPSVDLHLLFTYGGDITADRNVQDAEAKSISWQIDNPSIGDLTDLKRPNESAFRFTAKKAGTVTITVTGTTRNNLTDAPFKRSIQLTCEGFVAQARTVSVTPGNTTLFVPGPDAAKQLNPSTVQLAGTVTMDDASTNGNVSWSTTNPAVASVNKGLVTAVGAGNVTITATSADGQANGYATITVRTGGQANVSVQ